MWILMQIWEKGLCDDEVMEIYLSFWFFFSVFVLDFRLGIPGGRKWFTTKKNCVKCVGDL